ncbi:hypothetical protein L226DRAFT_570748 [Lentinus tigrinus ALCF2SS1-7]|uniref:Uncharacterized protein n=1 Tax=Lentinus tigrinus ALCF2SS1-6 TaxID=1328759 RepID=A0A5C2SCL0_9APHY|nr:hypothetical protein L227DRAFT_610593 [Lentinus tigrinus ALCF2SS1-6]RPD75080.1 hypothetical protein L226DRAFT_570748 [Lentinus tigrinus ALCF2SS1-7]
MTSATFCKIVLHVAGDVPASPVLGSGFGVVSPDVPFYPRLGVVPFSPLISASPSMSDGLCDLARAPPGPSSCAFPPMSSLPPNVFLQPPGGSQFRGLRSLGPREWYQGRRLRPAYIRSPGETSDKFILIAARFVDSPYAVRRYSKPPPELPETCWGYRPVITSPSQRRSWIDLVESPARYDDPRMVPLLECAAAWAMVFVMVPVEWQPFMVTVASTFFAICVISFL